MGINRKCHKCGYEWEQRVDNPVSCPECKARLRKLSEVKRLYNKEGDKNDLEHKT